MHEPGPISLSDGQLSVITQLAEPLAPPDRSAFSQRWRSSCGTSRSPWGWRGFQIGEAALGDRALHAQLGSRDRRCGGGTA
jgi:hypothetical protein